MVTSAPQKSPSLSVVIPTFNRGAVLLKTLQMLFAQAHKAQEVIVVDQTDYDVDDPVLAQLNTLHAEQKINFIKRNEPSIPAAMNAGLSIASADLVLFIDDDIQIDDQFIVNHIAAWSTHNCPAQVGRVLQPWDDKQIDTNKRSSPKQGLNQDIDFLFSSTEVAYLVNCMAGNLCVDRRVARQVGGFDENFIGAAYRFETEFAHRLTSVSQRLIYFAPEAVLDHLKLAMGGTRQTNFLTSASYYHSVGDYYFALISAKGWERWRYIQRRFFGACIARFYLRKPWHMPARMMGECRGVAKAFELYRSGPKLLSSKPVN